MPNCDLPPREGQRYCKDCHSVYMKAWRAKRKRAQERLIESVLVMRSQIVEKDREIAELKVG